MHTGLRAVVGFGFATSVAVALLTSPGPHAAKTKFRSARLLTTRRAGSIDEVLAPVTDSIEAANAQATAAAEALAAQAAAANEAVESAKLAAAQQAQDLADAVNAQVIE